MTGQEARYEGPPHIVNTHAADEGVLQVGGLRFHTDGRVEGLPEDAPEAARIFAAELLKVRGEAPATGQEARDDEREALANLIPLGFSDRDPYRNVLEAADAILAWMHAAGYRKHPEPEITDETPPEPKWDIVDEREAACVAEWPECASGEYDPRCCRFPKSCSAGSYRFVPVGDEEQTK